MLGGWRRWGATMATKARNRKDRAYWQRELPAGMNVRDRERDLVGTVVGHGPTCLKVSYWPGPLVQYPYSTVAGSLTTPDGVGV